ncbi:MAG TPA: DoxX family protein [Pseudonocardia sp.]|nr:DoxX family protein [Pseudonocardia sp.]
MSPDTSAASAATDVRPGRASARTGLVITILVDLFLLFDCVTKLIQLPAVVTGTVQLGFPAYTVPVMGALLLICLIVYNVPRTAVFGAVLLTGYLGGAVCANVRAELPLFGYVLAPVYVAVLAWLGLYLRSPALRQLVRSSR